MAEVNASKLEREGKVLMAQLEAVDEAKLYEWNKLIIREIKNRDTQKCFENSKQYRVGDAVEWKDKYGQWVRGIVARVNPKSVSMEANERGQRWKVHYSYLRLAE